MGADGMESKNETFWTTCD